MNMRVVPFEKQHLDLFEVQDAQLVESEALFHVEPNEHTITIMHRNAPVLIGAVHPIWPGRAMAWSYVSKAAGKCMLRLTREARALLDAGPRRVEMFVREQFTAGHRWARLLGMESEGLMKRFYANGDDGRLYARVKE